MGSILSLNEITISSIVFAATFAGALVGSLLRRILPDHHLASESKDVVRLGIGLVASMSALVLGLLVASAKSTYDADRSTVIQISAKIIVLDRLLATIGKEAEPAREQLKRTAAA